jgi:hypothetical protein
MQKYLILMFAGMIFLNLNAQQEELDSTDTRESVHLKDLHWIVDSTYGIFKTMKFSNLRTVYPTYSTFKKFIDTSAAGQQSEITQYAMYNRWWNGLRIQYTKLINKAYKAKIDWKKTRLDSFYIDTGGQGGNEYAYVHWIIQYNNKKKYLMSALFLKMGDKWFMMDELKYEGVIVEKKKKKKKK